MEEQRVRPTRSGLFAIELMIAVGVFVFCAAICVGLFVTADRISRDSADLSSAVSEARSVSECFKAAGGDIEQTASLSGAERTGESALALYYDGTWAAADKAEAMFRLELTAEPADGLVLGVLHVYDAADEPLLSWTVTASEVTP